MMRLGKRVGLIEGQMQHVVGVLDRLAERQEKLDDVMDTLAASHIKLAESHIRTQEQLQDLASPCMKPPNLHAKQIVGGANVSVNWVSF